MKYVFALLIIFFLDANIFAQQAQLIPVAKGWADNTVNTVVFRKNALVTFNDTQFVAFYNQQQYVVLAKRKLNTINWQILQTKFKGNTNDAHNCISIMVDGAGYLHLAWNHHNNILHYSKSIAPGSLQMSEEISMTGLEEQAVTYPEFYKMPNGDLLFMYRSGGSGKGNLVINKYNVQTQQWQQLYKNLIDGEGKRNAYWQACVDVKGVIHISWVWRESPDVASNHDLCYAKSIDGGNTWQKSSGEQYQLPVTAATAEYVCKIPQKSELINQTSMYADENSNAYIATYWRDKEDSVPQYHLVYLNGNDWKTQKLSFLKTSFSLSGMGSKQIPIARPQIVKWTDHNKNCTAVIFRAEEYGNKFLAAINTDLNNSQWQLKNITNFSVGSSEPLYDSELWKLKKQLHFFIQYTEQKDGEGKADIEPQMIQVLQWNIRQ